MAGRKRNSAEGIVRKLRRADELAAEGKTGKEIAAELQVSPATLYNWRTTFIRWNSQAFVPIIYIMSTRIRRVHPMNQERFERRPSPAGSRRAAGESVRSAVTASSDRRRIPGGHRRCPRLRRHVAENPQ